MAYSIFHILTCEDIDDVSSHHCKIKVIAKQGLIIIIIKIFINLKNKFTKAGINCSVRSRKMQARRKVYMTFKTTKGVSYQIENKREIPAAELQEFAYNLFQVCVFNSLLLFCLYNKKNITQWF